MVNGETGFVANAPLAKLISLQARGPAGSCHSPLPARIPGLGVRETLAGDEGRMPVKRYHGAGAR